MAKVKPVVLKSKIGIDGTTNIKIRLTHDGKSREISTPHYIDPKFMDRSGRIKDIYPGAAKLNVKLNLILAQYNSIIADIDDVNSLGMDALLSKLRGQEKGNSFIKYTESRIKSLKKEGRLEYATSYEVTLTHIKNHTGREDLLFKEITLDFLKNFELYLKLGNCKVNTVRIYLNNIRAVFNHALDNDVISLPSPFRKFKIKQEAAQKRSLDITDLKKLRMMPNLPGKQRALDIFWLSFFLIGMNIKDLCYLKPQKGDRLNYRRFKTRSLFSIEILPPARELLLKYKGDRYLLNFLDENDSYDHYKNFLKYINKTLRLAGVSLGVNSHISTYTARHSWATIAHRIGISRDDISLSLGHKWGAITADYIDFDLGRIDEANKKVIDYVFK